MTRVVNESTRLSSIGLILSCGGLQDVDLVDLGLNC